MQTINVFTMKEINELKKQFSNPETIKARRLIPNGYVLVRRKFAGGETAGHPRYEVPSLDIIEPTQEQLINAKIITAVEYRNSLL